MGNMSYCRFENTYYDLKNCYATLEEIDCGDEELSESESKYKDKLIKLCQNIVDDYADE